MTDSTENIVCHSYVVSLELLLLVDLLTSIELNCLHFISTLGHKPLHKVILLGSFDFNPSFSSVVILVAMTYSLPLSTSYILAMSDVPCAIGPNEFYIVLLEHRIARQIVDLALMTVAKGIHSDA